jgi:hypothetical protein
VQNSVSPLTPDAEASHPDGYHARHGLMDWLFPEVHLRQRYGPDYHEINRGRDLGHHVPLNFAAVSLILEGA